MDELLLFKDGQNGVELIVKYSTSFPIIVEHNFFLSKKIYLSFSLFVNKFKSLVKSVYVNGMQLAKKTSSLSNWKV